MRIPVDRAAQFALARPVTGGRGVSSCQLRREQRRRPEQSMFPRPKPRSDPPRLNGWMSLSRIAQTSDALMSPARHRQSIPTRPPADERRRLLRERRPAEAPLLDLPSQGRAGTIRVRDGTANAPGRLPSCSVSLANAEDRHASPGRSAGRRYRAPVRLASPATLPSRSASVPAALDRFAEEPEGSTTDPTKMRLADFCNPHFKDEHPSRVWIPHAFARENRAISRHPIRFARLTSRCRTGC
jgi:hypothetical protein